MLPLSVRAAGSVLIRSRVDTFMPPSSTVNEFTAEASLIRNIAVNHGATSEGRCVLIKSR